MKLIAYLIITVSLIAGALSAATAYKVQISDANASALADAGLTFKSPAGIYDPTPDATDTNDSDAEKLAERIATEHARIDTERAEQSQTLGVDPPQPLDLDLAEVPEVDGATSGSQALNAIEARAPIARPGDPVTGELIAVLLDQGVSNITVKEFSVARWPYAWLFGVSVIGLFAGAMLARSAARALPKPASGEAGSDILDEGARAALNEIDRIVRGLMDDLPALPSDGERLQRIVHDLTEVQRDHVPAFAADRPALVAALGLAGFAELMDGFAALERQINRAWSAAADHELAESLTSLENAEAKLPTVMEKLPA